jgi:hypothetical protein
MAALTFSETVEQSVLRQMRKYAEELGIKDPSVEDLSKLSKSINEQVKYLTTLMSPSYNRNEHTVSITEALRSSDASILFPKAISDVLLRPREPMMIGQQYLARTVQVDNVRSIEIPMLGALRAFDLGEGQEYPEQSLAFAQQFTEIRVNRVGLAFSISEDVIKDSMWDILGLTIEAAGYAMMRHKEEKIFNTAMENGHVVFDNNVNDPNFWTHGMGSGGNYNYTVTFDDLIDALGALVAHEYVPTDIIMHPLGWVVWAKDPVLRAQFLTGGQIGQSVWSTLPQFDQNINMPWNINYVVTPFQPITLRSKLTGHSGSGTAWPNPNSLPDANISHVTIIDRNQAVLVLQREPMEMDDFEDWRRDAVWMKFRERYGVAVLNQGRAISMIKNIRLDTNYAPVLSIRQITTP